MVGSRNRLESLLKRRELWYKELQRIKDNLVLPLLIGVILALLVGFGLYLSSPEHFGIFQWLTTILSGLVSSFGAFAWIEYRRNVLERTDESEKARISIGKLLDDVARVKPCSSLINLHRLLPCKYTDIFSQIIDESVADGGGILVSAGPNEYIKYLNKFLDLANTCFFATLRGGKYDPKYRISWFFTDDDKKDPHGMSSKQKLDYLDEVNRAEITTKIRILIFNENEPFFKNDFLNDSYRDDYFKYNSNVEVYLIPPEILIAQLGKKILKSLVEFIYDDFAVFDHEVVLKHNSSTSLYVATRMQIQRYLAVYDLLQEDHENRFFVKLTKENIGTLTWEQWKSSLGGQQ